MRVRQEVRGMFKYVTRGDLLLSVYSELVRIISDTIVVRFHISAIGVVR